MPHSSGQWLLLAGCFVGVYIVFVVACRILYNLLYSPAEREERKPAVRSGTVARTIVFWTSIMFLYVLLWKTLGS